MQNLLFESEFDLHENERSGKTYFHKNGFTRRLIFALRLKRIWKWPINCISGPKLISW